MKIYLSLILVALGVLFPGNVLAQLELELDQRKLEDQDANTCYNHELKNGDILKICVAERQCSSSSSFTLSQESSSLRDEKNVNITVCQGNTGENTEEDVSRPHSPGYFEPAWHDYDTNSQYYQDEHNGSPEPESHPQSWYYQEKYDHVSPIQIDSQSVDDSSTGQNESKSRYSRENSQFRRKIEKDEATYHRPRSNHSSQSYAGQQRDLESQVRSRQGSIQGQIPDRPQVEIPDHSRDGHTSNQETYNRPQVEVPEYSEGGNIPSQEDFSSYGHSQHNHNAGSNSPSHFGRSHR